MHFQRLNDIEQEMSSKDKFFERNEILDATISNLSDKIDMMLQEIETPIDLEENRTLFYVINKFSDSLEEIKSLVNVTGANSFEIKKFEEEALRSFEVVNATLIEIKDLLEVEVVLFD